MQQLFQDLDQILEDRQIEDEAENIQRIIDMVSVRPVTEILDIDKVYEGESKNAIPDYRDTNLPGNVKALLGDLEHWIDKLNGGSSSKDLTKDRDLVNFSEKMGKLSMSLKKEIRSKHDFLCKELNLDLESPESILEDCGKTPENMKLIDEYEREYAGFKQSFPNEFRSKQEVQKIRVKKDKLQELSHQFDRDVPPVMKNFFQKITQGEATLDDFTEDVRLYLSGKGQLKSYIVNRRSDT